MARLFFRLLNGHARDRRTQAGKKAGPREVPPKTKKKKKRKNIHAEGSEGDKDTALTADVMLAMRGSRVADLLLLFKP